jgi:putative addiction module component (TIGR02574 family)
MARDPAQLLHEALDLPAELRAALADSLLDSLDATVDEGAETAWREEVERRLVELDRGDVVLIFREDAQSRLRARLKH